MDDLALGFPSCITEARPFNHECVQGNCSAASSEGDFCFTAHCKPGLVCQPNTEKSVGGIKYMSFRCNKKEENPGVGDQCKIDCAPAFATSYVPNTTTHVDPPKLLTTEELQNLALMNRTFCSYGLVPTKLEPECVSKENTKQMQCGFKLGDACAFDAKGKNSLCEAGSSCNVDLHGGYRCQKPCTTDTDCPAIQLPALKLGGDGSCHMEQQNLTSSCVAKKCQVQGQTKGSNCGPGQGHCPRGLECLPTPTRDPGGKYVEIRHRCREPMEFADEGFKKNEGSQCGPVFAYSVEKTARPHLFVHSLPPDFLQMCQHSKNITDLFHVLELHEHGELCVLKQGEECGHNLGLGANDVCEPGTNCSLVNEDGIIWRCRKEFAEMTVANKTQQSRAAAAGLLPDQLMLALLTIAASLRSQARPKATSST